MTRSLLITQCLQGDFVQPIGRHDPIPNLLHVGFEEARRLMGEDPAQGPVARVMQWAYDLDDEALEVIHIRDWHDPRGASEQAHLEQFGAHCLRGSGIAPGIMCSGTARSKLRSSRSRCSCAVRHRR